MTPPEPWCILGVVQDCFTGHLQCILKGSMMIEIKNVLSGEVICSGPSAIVAVRRAIRDSVSLERADLRGMDLRGIDLKGADLRYSSCIATSFRDVNFMEADFYGANMRNALVAKMTIGRVGNPNAYRRRADLRRIKRFGRANIKTVYRHLRKEWANLRWVKASRATHPTADLRFANLNGATLDGADLRGSDFRWVNLGFSDLTGSDFREIDTDHITGWKGV